MAQQMNPGSYDMGGERKALMLCVRDEKGIKEKRCGFEVDRQTMEKFFKDFNFCYQFVLDKNTEDMRNAVKDFRDSINSSKENISCVLVVTSSHGNRHGIQDAQGDILKIKDIITPFGDELCPKMKGKPKIFIIDACRGHNTDTGVYSNSVADLKPPKEDGQIKKSRRVPPCINDMLVAYSAMTDYIATMSCEGSTMINCISKVFSSPDSAKEHLYDSFVKANAEMVEKTGHLKEKNIQVKNIMEIESTCRKLIYLRSKTSCK
ncbi:hypothetical protein UPYG_G00048310 [Umbra pygmaea]|uniref:Caspase family p20 domain-containing protein n=1 Tax=Umbra pygmaea TaxID=75934 RepID=A0ABD0XU17_UMBPY